MPSMLCATHLLQYHRIFSCIGQPLFLCFCFAFLGFEFAHSCQIPITLTSSYTLSAEKILNSGTNSRDAHRRLFHTRDFSVVPRAVDTPFRVVLSSLSLVVDFRSSTPLYRSALLQDAAKQPAILSTTLVLAGKQSVHFSLPIVLQNTHV